MRVYPLTVLHDCCSPQKLTKTGGASVDKATIDTVLTEMGGFCENELAPLNAVGDAEGCTHVGEYEVKTPTGCAGRARALARKERDVRAGVGSRRRTRSSRPAGGRA